MAVGAFVEDELTENGSVAPVATILLANRECPWKCLMCDLWRNTVLGPTPAGAVVRQIRDALARFPGVRRVKLYNAGSFFDAAAVPPSDREETARRLDGFERVIVECHPALVGDACRAFAGALDGRLEVAIGLETVHPGVLPRLNKEMTLADFEAAARRLASFGASLRAFVLVGLPWVASEEFTDWAVRSVRYAFGAGATAVSLISMRSGNGAMEALAAHGEFFPPTLECLEDALDRSIGLGLGRVFADLWDLESFRACPDCFGPRRERLALANLTQTVPPRAECGACGAGT
jgi:radical SAM enzyme (TIGR01210 family)